MEKLRFSTEIAVYLGNGMRWKVNRKSKVADRSVSVPMTSSDLERRNARAQIFSGDHLSNARTVRPRMTKFGRMGRDVFLRVSHAPAARKQGSSAPEFLRFHFMHTRFDVKLANLTW